MAAAEAPGGSDDFGDVGFFEEGEGGEFGRQSVAEFFVDAAFFGFDEITAGVEAVDEKVLNY